MRKVIYLFAVVATTLSFTSCSKDDDSPEQDQIIGKWKLVQEFENNEEYQLECDDLLEVEFKSDDTYTVQYYDLDANDACVLGGVDFEGTWKNSGANSYSLTDSGDTVTVTITVENNKLTLTSTDGDDIYKSVYQKI